MELKKAIAERRSIRRYAKKRIPEAALTEVLQAALWAPSAGNLQSRKFYVVRNATAKERVADVASQQFIASADVVVVVCTDSGITRRYGERGATLYCVQDAAAATQNLMLAAHAHGIGSCWVGAFDEEALAEALQMPAHLRPVAIIPLGYPAEAPDAPRRVRIEDACVFID